MDGWVSLHRKVRLSAVWQDPELFRLWCLCLLKATHKPHKQMIGNQLVELMPGQFVTGRESLAEEYNRDLSPSKRISPISLWRRMKKLEKLENLNIKTTNKYSVITIVNWSEYQEDEQQMNNKRTTNEQQMNTNNNIDDDDFWTSLENQEPTEEEKLKQRVERYYQKKKGRIDPLSAVDIQALDKLVQMKVSEEEIISTIDYAFEKKKGRVNSFSYCATIIFNRWAEEADKKKENRSSGNVVRSFPKKPYEPARGNVIEKDIPDSVQLLKDMERKRKKEMMEAT